MAVENTPTELVEADVSGRQMKVEDVVALSVVVVVGVGAYNMGM